MSDVTVQEVLGPPEIDLGEVPAFPEVLKALASIALLGAVAGLGSGSVGTAARVLPSGLATGVGALLLTAPALIVLHQFLGLRGRPEALVGALVRAVTRFGTLCLGMAPFVGFFSVTSRLSVVLFPAVLVLAASFSMIRLVRDLVATETATDEAGRLAREGTMAVLVLGWGGLTTLVAVRIAWDVAWFVIGGAL